MFGRLLVGAHRWLGIVFGALFVVWFLSGIVMMYRGMPELDPATDLALRPPLDFSTARVAPAEAAGRAGVTPDTFELGMVAQRPVYRFSERGRPSVVFADTGYPFDGVDEAGALALVDAYLGEQGQGEQGHGEKGNGELRHDGYLRRPDQWTLQSRQLLPMHRLALDDGAGTRLYLSERTGAVELVTTRSSRAWGMSGAVLHWLYFTPLRRHSALWYQVVVWSSVLGALLCLSGLVWGFWVVASHRRLPYRGWLFWHHLLGLVFGLFTFTFVVSGLLSMEPLGWPPRATRGEVGALAGGPLALDGYELGDLKAALGELAQGDGQRPRRVEAVQFDGAAFLLEQRAAGERRLVSVAEPGGGPFSSFERAAVERAVRESMPSVELLSREWLDSYDSYYYDRRERKPLPVLRARFDDDAGTTLYVDPVRGRVVHAENRLTRFNRWLYHGLHSWDFPGLYRRRPLWDVVVLVLLGGGLAASVSAFVPGVRRLRRVLRRGVVASRARGGEVVDSEGHRTTQENSRS